MTVMKKSLKIALLSLFIFSGQVLFTLETPASDNQSFSSHSPNVDNELELCCETYRGFMNNFDTCDWENPDTFDDLTCMTMIESLDEACGYGLASSFETYGIDPYADPDYDLTYFIRMLFDRHSSGFGIGPGGVPTYFWAYFFRAYMGNQGSICLEYRLGIEMTTTEMLNNLLKAKDSSISTPATNVD